MKANTLLLVACLFSAPAFAANDSAAVAPIVKARALFADPARTTEATLAFEKIISVDPACVEARNLLVHLALRRGEPELAVTLAEKVVALAPDNADCQHTLGDAYCVAARQAGIFRALGLGKKGIAAYERTVVLAPDNADYRYSLFEIYRQAPGFMGGGADKALVQATALQKLDDRRGRLAFATLHAADKNYALARKELDEVLKRSPDDYAALFQLGRLAVLSGEAVDQGLASLQRCLELPCPEGSDVPDHAAVQWRLGNIFEKKASLDAARAAYEAALKLNPNFSEAADSLKKLK